MSEPHKIRANLLCLPVESADGDLALYAWRDDVDGVWIVGIGEHDDELAILEETLPSEADARRYMREYDKRATTHDLADAVTRIDGSLRLEAGDVPAWLEGADLM